ncbi:MAG: hypothetical protein ACRYFU_10760 [Janthinobacterium lividum]
MAGSFTAGGTTIGAQQLHELNVELDQNVIFTSKKQLLKAGTQLMLYRERQQFTTNFNGTYTFGGGTAPVLDSNNAPISGATGVEQYRRALLNFAGGTPTAFSNVVGTFAVHLTNVRVGFFCTIWLQRRP